MPINMREGAKSRDAGNQFMPVRFAVPVSIVDPAERIRERTGNPRVANRDSLFARLQAIEFTSIVSLQKRAQRVWGRILTVSGVVGAFHRSALDGRLRKTPEI